MTTKTSRFSPGTRTATPGALAALVAAGESPATYLARHLAGDFGDLDLEDVHANRRDIADGDGRVLSSYTLPTGVRLWLITNLMDGQGYDTCLLLPEEY
jgi:hypothetical protein